uniref:Allatostatin-A3 n=1 Tax=Delia radicum TaxID=30064 RepID=ALLA3_DELRA|nr:RecName: Full=Allatostatin-A3; Short=AST-A3; AltName: Full=VERYAFGL-amide [Delia radicum]
VERYAFGL